MFPCRRLSVFGFVDNRHLVTIPFHQIIRSTTPLFVIAISITFLEKSYTRQIYLSLIPVTNHEMILC